MLINKHKIVGLNDCNDPKVFSGRLKDMDDIIESIDNYNPNKTHKIMIVFDDMIADLYGNKKFQQIVTEFFIKGRKLNISFVFIMQSYFVALKKLD